MSPIRVILNIGLVSLSCLVAFVFAEWLLRFRYAEPLRTPSPEVLAIQPHLRLHPVLGFTWNADIKPQEEIVFVVKDAEFEALSTDEFGFINHPDAIEKRRAGTTPDIIGLGDSFFEHASQTFYRVMGEAGLNYYGMAIHRQSPPQYNVILRDYALPLRPRWLIYGLFENDFAEAQDYFAWRRSGLDWFEFHSGTWCGPSVPLNAGERFRATHLRGFQGLFHVIRSRLRGDNQSISGPGDIATGDMAATIFEGFTMARENDIGFLLVLIPGRGTITNKDSPESEAYDRLLDMIEMSTMPVLDLRDVFLSHDAPESLYYVHDGHWNRRGMELAAYSILERIGLSSDE